MIHNENIHVLREADMSLSRTKYGYQIQLLCSPVGVSTVRLKGQENIFEIEQANYM